MHVLKKSRKVTNSGRHLQEDPKVFKNMLLYPYTLMCFMTLTSFMNVRVHVNTGAKGNLVKAERDLNILRFESFKYKQMAAETNRRIEVHLHV